MKETPRRLRQIEAWVRWQMDQTLAKQSGEQYFAGAKAAARIFARILWADASRDTRDAAAHALRVYRGVRGHGTTRYLRDIRFLTEDDQGHDAIVDPVVMQDLGILKDAEQRLNRFGFEWEANFAFDICSEAFHERHDPCLDLVNMILVERAERLESKLSKRIPPDGMRVRLQPNGCIDRYPHFQLRGDIKGTVVRHKHDFVVKIDQHFCDLREWDNEVSYIDTVEHFWDEWVPEKETA